MRESTVAGRFSKLLAVALCTLLLGVCTSASAQSLTFATFEAPGAGTASDQGTFAASINNSGVGTGYYVDSYGNPHGYLRARDGTITTIDIPGPEGALDECGTTPSSINSGGAITGADCFGGGFLRPPDGTFTLFNQSFPSGINDSGAITGNFPDTGYLVRGFLRAPDGTVTTFDEPDAGNLTGSCCGTNPTAINTSGTIAGFYIDGNGAQHGFLRAPDGTFTSFDPPGASTEFSQGTWAYSINQSGAITGWYYDANSVIHGFLRAPDGTFTAFDAPGASSANGLLGTRPYSINTSGAITGFYQDANGVVHGFRRAANGTFTTLDAPGAGHGTFAFSINQAGAIAGNYWDSSTVSHGFVATDPQSPLHGPPHGRHHGRGHRDRD